MFTSDKYPKRQTIPNTAHGNSFQIYKAMYTAFCYALQKKLDFEMHLENEDYGDFDDMILITPDKIIATQYKHHLESTEQGLTGFITGNKKDQNKLGFSKYFDSLYEKNTSLKSEYVFCSNNTLPNEIKECLDNNCTKFSSDFFTEETTPRLKYLRSLIYTSIFKFSQNLSDYFQEAENHKNLNDLFSATPKFLCDQPKGLNPKATSFEKVQYLKVTKVKESKALKGNAIFWIDICLTNFAFTRHPNIKNEISNFLKKIKFEFDSKNLEEMKNQVENAIKTRFHTSNDLFYHVFFHEFYSNLISQKAVVITNIDIQSMFQKWHTKYVLLERLCGITQDNLTSKNHTINGKILERIDLHTKLNEFFSGATASKIFTSNQILLIKGLAGVGKSALAKQCIKKLNYPDGKIIFLDILQLKTMLLDNKNVKPKQLLQLEFIFIDNSELALGNPDLLEKLLSFTKKNIQSNKKVIFLIREEYSVVFVKELSNLGKSIKEINVPILTSKEIRECGIPDQSFPQRIFKDILSIPFYLNLAIKNLSKVQELNEQNLTTREMQQQLISFRVSSKSSNNRSEFNGVSVKARKAVLREIIYNKSQKNKSFVALQGMHEDNVIQSLMNDGILISHNNRYDFSHLLYAEWTINHIANSLLQSTVESNDTVQTLLETLKKRLPHHGRIYGLFLHDNLMLKKYLKLVHYKSFDKKLDNLANLAVFALDSRDNVFIDNILEVVYESATITPDNYLKIFRKIDFREEDQINFLRNCDGLVNLLGRFANFEKTYASAVDALCNLIDKEMEAEDRHNHDHIQYILDMHFSPVLGKISYQQRLAYLTDSMMHSNKAIALLPALYHCIKIYCYKELPETYGDTIDTGFKVKTIYGLPRDNAIIDDYCSQIFQFLISAANSQKCFDLSSEAQSLLIDFIEDNFGNFLVESFTRKAILNILNNTAVGQNDDIYVSINKIYKEMKSKGAEILHSPDVFEKFRKRITLFREALEARKMEYEDVELPVMSKMPSIFKSSTTLHLSPSSLEIKSTAERRNLPSKAKIQENADQPKLSSGISKPSGPSDKSIPSIREKSSTFPLSSYTKTLSTSSAASTSRTLPITQRHFLRMKTGHSGLPNQDN